jgi:hypothetical protein
VVAFLSAARPATAARAPQVSEKEDEMGKFTATVKGGLHANYSSVLSSIEAWNSIMDHRYTAQSLAHKGDFEARALLAGLIGAAAGGTITLNYSEIEANVELGGRRNIVSTPIINRVSTAADVSDLKNEIAALSVNTFNPTPVINGDRNPLGTR